MKSRQVAIIRHALCGTSGDDPFRNRFVASTSHADYSDLIELVDCGLMTRQRYTLDEMNETYIFRVTDAGAVAAGIPFTERRKEAGR